MWSRRAPGHSPRLDDDSRIGKGTKTAAMNVDVVPAESLSADQIDRWKSIQESDPAFASPFLSPHFTRIVATARDDVHVAVLEEGGRVVASSLQRGRFGAGRPAGWKISDYQGGVAEQRDVEYEALVRACGLKTWEFDHVIAAHWRRRPWRGAGRSRLIDPSRGFDAYVRERRDAGVHLFRDAAQGEEAGARAWRASVRGGLGQDPDAFRTLMRWKRRQDVRKGAADVVARPWVEHSLELAYGRREPDFAGILSLLFAGDRVVAAGWGCGRPPSGTTGFRRTTRSSTGIRRAFCSFSASAAPRPRSGLAQSTSAGETSATRAA